MRLNKKRAVLFFSPFLFNTSLAWASGGASPEPAPQAEEHHEEAHDEEHAHLAKASAKSGARDVQIPRALVARIETGHREYLVANKLEAKETIPRQLLQVSVYFTQDKRAALTQGAQYSLPLGGGVIDLADRITPLRGKFKLKFKIKDHLGHSVSKPRVFFVSRTKARNLAGDVFGSGCGKFMEISHLFNSTLASEGLDLYSSDQRYLSVIGGTFLIVSSSASGLAGGSVTFEDSRYPRLSCEAES